MKRLLILTCSMLLAVGAMADSATCLQYAAQKNGTNGVAMTLGAWGITNPADRAVIIGSDFDVQTTFALAVRDRAWPLAVSLSQNHYLTPSNQATLGRAFMTAQPSPPATLFLVWLQTIPLAQRARFTDMATNMAVHYASGQPVYSTLFTKYTVLQGIPLNDPRVIEQDLAAYLLAPEPMTAAQVTSCKQALKDKATALARQQLRAMTNPPVASNGVSAVATLIAPVVTALNAPACSGLETALQGLGSTIANVDRTALLTLVPTWQTNAMNGLSPPATVTAQLGKISVALGVEVFNHWVGVYNTGN